jgi:hypothetical protein
MVENRVGPPVRGKDFYGRTRFVDLVATKLQAGHVLLAAPRRFGKTSVMYNLIDQPRWDYQVVHADLEHFIEPSELITKLIEQLASDSKFAKFLEGLSYLPKQLWSAFRNNVEEIELYEARLKFKEQIRPRWQESGEELFKRVATFPIALIVILDEFPMMIDRMARSDAYRVEAQTLLRWLRALRLGPQNRNVHFLIAGSIGIGRILNQLGEIKSINDFEQMRLEPFTPSVATSFLEQLAQSSDLSLAPACIAKMLALLGTPVPYFLQILFSEVAKVHALDGDEILPETIERIYHDKVLGVDCKTYFDHYYGRLRDYYDVSEEKAAKRILHELAVVGAMTRDACWQFYQEQMGRGADSDAFNLLMTDLENDFYIRFEVDTHRYHFACKLLRDWWLRHYGMTSGN